MSENKLTSNSIIKDYMEFILTHGEQPKSVYIFSKDLNFREKDFYQFFSSFQALESKIFVQFFENTIELLNENDEYSEFEPKNKLLSFYYTFFETLTANRSFVVQVLKADKERIKTLKKLLPLRKVYKEYVKTMDIQLEAINLEKAENTIQKSIAEMSWGQLVLILKYWLNDTSPGFEKTDVLIEKTMNTGFDLLKVKPLESVVDLGKFLFKELSNK